MDATDEASMQAVVERILAERGRIDVLVSAAGYGSYGARIWAARSDRRRRQADAATWRARCRTSAVVSPQRSTVRITTYYDRLSNRARLSPAANRPNVKMQPGQSLQYSGQRGAAPESETPPASRRGL